MGSPLVAPVIQLMVFHSDSGISGSYGPRIRRGQDRGAENSTSYGQTLKYPHGPGRALSPILGVVTLEIDHIFWFVEPDADWVAPVSDAGWALDEGVEHVGQGTRNRRLWLPEHYLEFIWLSSRTDAANNPLRLDRRADWRTTGACPFGIGLRGQLDEGLRSEFWAYHPPYARGACIWIHRSNEMEPAAPLVFVMEAPAEAIPRSLPRHRLADKPQLFAHARSGTIGQINLQTATPPQALLVTVTPRVAWSIGSHPHLEVVLGDSSVNAKTL